MGTEESMTDDYGFTRYSTSSTTVSCEESPTQFGYGRPIPDHRRFAIALSELPALNYYNPLLNNPSSSEYIASVRSSIRSIDEIASAQFHVHPRTISMRDSIPPTTTHMPSAFQLWGQNSVKNLECNPTNDAKRTNKSVTFSSNFTLIGKSCWAFCISVWTVLLLGAAAGAALYFAGKSGKLFQIKHPPPGNIVYGEFHLAGRQNLSEPSGDNTTVANLANQLQNIMDVMFQSSPLVATFYNRSVLFGIVPSANSEKPAICIQFKIHLNHPDLMIAEKMAYVVTSNLYGRDDNSSDHWAHNLTAIKFAEVVPSSTVSDSPTTQPTSASWGLWTEWSPECYLTSCDRLRTQSRNRRCLLRDRRPDLIVIEEINSTLTMSKDSLISCMAGSTVSAAAVEIRPCSCVTSPRATSRPRIPFQVVRRTKGSHFRFSNVSIEMFDKTCSQCRHGEVCVARLEEVVPVCRWAPEPDDPSGCGGFCRANTEFCIPLGSNSFKCEGVSECLTDSEWRCGDGFCIHNLKRCDGDYNCFDHSDELDCQKENVKGLA